jgi:integrase/recombinase XerD
LMNDYVRTLQSEATKRSYRGILTGHIEFLGPNREASTVTKSEILLWKEAMDTQETRYADHPRRPTEEGGLSPFTIYRNLKTAKTFWKWSAVWDEDLARSPMKALELKKPKRSPVTEKAASLPTLYALLNLMRVYMRDAALYLFILDTGCRCGGVCKLTLDKLNLKRRRAMVKDKGNNEHPVFFSVTTAIALRSWLEVRPAVESQAVFLSFATMDHLTPAGITMTLRRLCKRSNTKVIGPHAIRHAVGVHLANNGEQLSLIRELFGHTASTVTLDSYMPDSEPEIRDMIDRNGLAGWLKDIESIEEVEDEDWDIDFEL